MIYANEIEEALFAPIPQHLTIRQDQDSFLPSALFFCHEDETSLGVYSSSTGRGVDVHMLFSRTGSQSPSSTSMTLPLSLPSWQALRFPSQNSPLPSQIDLSRTTTSSLKSRIDQRELPQNILTTAIRTPSPARNNRKGSPGSGIATIGVSSVMLPTTSTCASSSNVLCFMS